MLSDRTESAYRSGLDEGVSRSGWQRYGSRKPRYRNYTSMLLTLSFCQMFGRLIPCLFGVLFLFIAVEMGVNPVPFSLICQCSMYDPVVGRLWAYFVLSLLPIACSFVAVITTSGYLRWETPSSAIVRLCNRLQVAPVAGDIVLNLIWPQGYELVHVCLVKMHQQNVPI